MSWFTALEDDFKLGMFWLSLETFTVWLVWRTACVVRWIAGRWRRGYHALGSLIGWACGAIAWLCGWFVALIALRYVHYFRKINVRRKCPCCGVIQRHKIRFDPTMGMKDEVGVVIHECSRCGAVSGELPIFPTASWLTIPGVAKGAKNVN